MAFTQHMQGTWPHTNFSHMALISVANAVRLLGLTHEQWNRAAVALGDAGLDLCQLDRPEARVGPLPRPLVPRAAKAPIPSLREATSSHDLGSMISDLVHDMPAKKWCDVAAVYTDGSKRESSLSFAWFYPAAAITRQYKAPGPASAQRTVLQAE